MIRRFEERDINAIAEIWLDTNIKAHNFISDKYWKDHFEKVKKLFLQAEIYAYADEISNEIQGFIGLNNNYIAGIFVREEYQSKGIGRQLLDYVKRIKSELSLNVYKKNVRAVKFYQKEDFKIINESTDENTKEKEYTMIWKQ